LTTGAEGSFRSLEERAVKEGSTGNSNGVTCSLIGRGGSNPMNEKGLSQEGSLSHDDNEVRRLYDRSHAALGTGSDL